VNKTIARKGKIGRLPWFLNPFPRQSLTPDSDIGPPWPDIWIAAGRATLPLIHARQTLVKGRGVPWSKSRAPQRADRRPLTLAGGAKT